MYPARPTAAMTERREIMAKNSAEKVLISGYLRKSARRPDNSSSSALSASLVSSSRPEARTALAAPAIEGAAADAGLSASMTRGACAA